MIALLVACGAPTPTIHERFGDRPFLYPIDAPPTVALVAGGEVPTTAASCGSCHTDHYAEWSGSTHAWATRDLQYSAELSKPGQPRWLCLNCHAPTRPQREQRFGPGTRVRAIDDIASTPEPLFDAARVSEGVTCAACHVRRDADGQGTVVGPRGSGRAPHRVRHDPEALQSVCARCHAPEGEPISTTFVCWFDTHLEVARGPTPDARCAECHMPQTSRPAAVGAPVETVRRHWWLGGGVPKTFAGYARLKEAGWRSAVDVKVGVSPLTVTLTNARAAHAVPTADPERHLTVVARVEGSDGSELGRDTLRIGQRWDWGDEATGRVARRIEDNRLAPGETRVWTPTLPAGGARVVVEVTHVRLAAENAEGMKAAELDDELVRLYPAAVEQLPQMERFYPMETVLFMEVVPR